MIPYPNPRNVKALGPRPRPEYWSGTRMGNVASTVTLNRNRRVNTVAIKSYKPTTSSRRQMTVTDYSGLSKVAPEKSLLAPLKNNSGRNSYGRITVRHRGGGNRTKYRIIDFKRDKVGMNANVLTFEYDPNRSAHIALVQYEDGEKTLYPCSARFESRRCCPFRRRR